MRFGVRGPWRRPPSAGTDRGSPTFIMKALVPPPLFPLNGDAATLFGPPLGAASSSPPFRTVIGDVEAAVSCVFTGREYAGGGSHNHGGGRIPCVFCSGASVTVQAQRETEGETYVATSKMVSG